MLETEFFFIDDTNIFDQENMPKKDKKLIMDLIDRTTFIGDAKKYLEQSQAEIEIPNDKQKKIKRDKILVNKDEKRPDASAENKLMKNAKTKNEFVKGDKKNKRKSKKSYSQRVKEKMGEYKENKSIKRSIKLKKSNYGETASVENERNKNNVPQKSHKRHKKCK